MANDPRLPPIELEPAPRDELFDFRMVRHWVGFVLHATRRHLGLAALAFLGVVLLSVGALLVIPYRYQVSASVLATRTPVMGVLSNPGMNREWDLPTRSARESIMRRDNLVALCKQTNFVQKYLATRAPAVRAVHWLKQLVTGKPLDPEALQEGIVDALETRLWINVDPNEGVVVFTFQWSDPDLAYQMVNAAVQGFLEARHTSEVNGIGETIGILQVHDNRILEEVAVVTKHLEEKERTLRVQNAPRLAPRPAVTAPDDETAQLRAQLTVRRRALEDLEAFRMRRLQELETQLDQQLPIYSPHHPAILATRRSIETLNTPSPQVAALQAEIKGLEGEIGRRGGRPDAPADPYGLAAVELAQARFRMADEDPRLEVERNQLRLLLRQHSSLLERIDAAKVEMDTTRAAFKYRYVVTSPPQMPKGPIQPKPVVVLLGGILGGLAFALFACAFVDLRSDRIYEPWQVERRLELPLLGEIDR